MYNTLYFGLPKHFRQYRLWNRHNGSINMNIRRKRGNSGIEKIMNTIKNSTKL